MKLILNIILTIGVFLLLSSFNVGIIILFILLISQVAPPRKSFLFKIIDFFTIKTHEKMKKLLSYVSFLIIVFITSSSITSCDTYENELNITDKSVYSHNLEVILSYKKEISDIASSRRGKETMHKKDVFVKYFNDYYVTIDGATSKLGENEIISVEELYTYVLEKSESFKNYTNSQSRTTNDLTDDEIRDALHDECDTYIWVVAEYCKLAVDIAYILR